MRVFGLVLLGLIAWLVTLVVLFPAAPVIDRLRPQLGPVALEGVSGPLWRGRVASARSTDDLLPLELENVRWRLAPSTLPAGGGARIDFDGYGGSGTALVTRRWNNDIEVADVQVTARAKALEPLLPVPVAAFEGELRADIEQLVIEAGLLDRFLGSLTWSDAVLERPIAARFGTVQIEIEPDGDALHAGTLALADGDVDGGGRFTIAPNGDFTIDVALTPTPSAPAGIVDALRQIARPDASGAYRLQQSGNVNRLM